MSAIFISFNLNFIKYILSVFCQYILLNSNTYIDMIYQVYDLLLFYAQPFTDMNFGNAILQLHISLL